MMRWLQALAVALAVLSAGGAAGAQNPYSAALTVNNGVITHYDIAQRMAFLDALGASGDLRALAIEQLTEDRVKVQAAEDMGIFLPEGALGAGLEEFATDRGITVDQVLQVLAARRIDRQTLDDFIQSGLLWREVVTARFRARAMPSEADLDAALAVQANAPQEIVELGEIALPFGERGEEATRALAERLSRELSRGGDFTAAVREYSRSDSVAQGGRLPPMPARNMPAEIRGQVLLLGPGQVTAPIPISGGLAILKLLAIRTAPPPAANAAAPAEPGAEREALREQLFSQRIASFGQGYLQELLRDALIIER